MEYRRGAKDPDVGRIQQLLNNARSTAVFSKMYEERSFDNWPHLEIDNDFGEKTENAVKSFQKIRGITPVSGIVGNTTWNYLSSFSPSMMAPVNLNFNREFREGDSGPEVKEIQRLLNTVRNYLPMSERPIAWEYIAEDGVYGPRTRNSIISFQMYAGIEKNYWGIVESATLRALRDPYSRSIKYNRYINECSENRTIGELFLNNIINPFLQEAADIENYPQYRKIQLIDPNKAAKEITANCNELVRVFYSKLIRCISQWNNNFKDCWEDIVKQTTQKAKKNNGKHTKKVEKYNKNIDNYIQTVFKNYTKTQVTYVSVSKLIKVTRNGVKFIGKVASKADLILSFSTLCDDLNNMSDTTEWQVKWNKDFSDALEGVIAIAIGALVGALIGPGFIAILAGILVAVIISVIHSVFRNFAWYNDFEANIGATASENAKRIIDAGFSQYQVYDGYYLTVVYPKS